MNTTAPTLFDILGVGDDVDTDGVKDRFQEHWIAAGCDYGAVPREIMYAERILRDVQGRSVYKEILRACNGEFPLKIEPDQEAHLREICEIAQIRIFELPNRPNTYEFRRANQEAPYWSQEVPGFPRAPEPASRRMIRGAWRFMTFQVFLETSAWEKLGLVLLYSAIAAAVAYSVPRAQDAVAQYQVSSRMDSVRELRSKAQRNLAGLRENIRAFATEFQDVTQVPLGTSDLTPNLEVAMLEHPTVREAWNAIHKNHLSKADLDRVGRQLSMIEFQDAGVSLLDDYLDQVQKVLALIEGQSQVLALQRRDLNHIGQMVQAEVLPRTQAED